MSIADDQTEPRAWTVTKSMDGQKGWQIWATGLRSTIGRRFALATISCSTLLAFLMTTIQLAADYEAGKASQNTSLSRIETSILPGLAESLWLLDEALITSQLLGIAHLEGVSRVDIMGTEDVLRVINEPDPQSFPIEYPILRVSAGETIQLGTLVVQVSHTHLARQILNRALIVLATNLFKAICMTFAILYVFQRLVGENLSRLVDFANAYDPEATGQRITLGRADGFRSRAQGCEFQSLETSINRWSMATETYVQQLRHANREQAEFTYAISHDLKSPTNTMAMLISELEDLGAVDENGYDIVNDMRATNKRMGQLVVDVLDYSRLVEAEMRFEPIRLGDVVADIEKDLAAEIAQAGAVIQYGDLPQINGHLAQVRILLQNLVSNAVKFRAPDRPPVVRIEAASQPEAISIMVADNGIGIPEKFRDGVFGLFKRLHSRSVYDGSGLGLAICRRVMSHHGGTIEIKAGADGGTAFELKFPRKMNDQTN